MILWINSSGFAPLKSIPGFWGGFVRVVGSVPARQGPCFGKQRLFAGRGAGEGGEQSQHISAPGEGERVESEALEIANKVNDNPGAGGTQRTAAGERRLGARGQGRGCWARGGWDGTSSRTPTGAFPSPPGASRPGFWGCVEQGGSRRGPLAPLPLLEDPRGAGGCGHPSASRGRVLGAVWAWCNPSELARVDRAACWLFRKHQIGEN